MRADEVVRQIHDFRDKGLGGFFIHARFGLETEYLSREWMELVKLAVETAAGLGLEVWLYDENGFPSGIGNLKVSRIPEYRPKFIDLTERVVNAGELAQIALPIGSVALAYAQRLDGISERLPLQDAIEANRLDWQAPAGKWRVSVYSKCTLEDENSAIYGVDYLSPDAMRFFFDYTLSPYEKAIGEHFGGAVKGIFTDEPTLLPWHHQGSWMLDRPHPRLVTWNDLLEKSMTYRGYASLADFLPHLFYDVDNSTPQVRLDYWQSVADLYRKAFFEPYAQWCKEHNMVFTGHVLFEEGLFINLNFQSDVTSALASFDIPGTDHLGLTTEEPYGGRRNVPDQLTNIQGEKLAPSIAHISGRQIAMSETYGCAGWSLNFQDMKRIADWQYSLGINMLVPHAAFYSLEGYRKSDAPPSQSHMAGWEHYGLFANYIGRLSYALREGVHVAQIALAYPFSEFAGSHRVGDVGESDTAISDTFDLCSSLIPRLHYDYDIVPENAISAAATADGALQIGEKSYQILVASVRTLWAVGAEAVAGFLRSGGAILLPSDSLADVSEDDLSSRIAALCGMIGVEVPECSLTTDLVATCRVAGGRVCAMLAGTQDRGRLGESLSDAIRALADPDVTISYADGRPAPDIRYLHRQSGSEHIYYVCNLTDEAARLTLGVRVGGMAQIWDPETGTSSELGATALEGGGQEFSLALPSLGTTLVVIREESGQDTSTGSLPAVPVNGNTEVLPPRVILEMAQDWQFRALGPNALPLETWTVCMHKGSIQGPYHSDTFVYESGFVCECAPSEVRLMLDDVEYREALMGRMDMTVDVNGRTWDNPEFGYYLDRGFKTLDITEAVQTGRNAVSVYIRHFPFSGLPHFLTCAPYLLGDFSVSGVCFGTSVVKHTGGVLMAPAEAAMTGSWTDCGYPFYSGTAEYTQSFRLPKTSNGARLAVVMEGVRDSVEVLVNGVPGGVRMWAPWEVDVTGLLTPGRNVLTIRVTNTMANFIERIPHSSGLTGRVSLVEFG